MTIKRSNFKYRSNLEIKKIAKFTINPNTLEMLPNEKPLQGDTILINPNNSKKCPENTIILADGHLTSDPCFKSCITYWQYGVWYTYQIMETNRSNIGVLALVQRDYPEDTPGREVLSSLGTKRRR
jgi:hypothetical protein